MLKLQRMLASSNFSPNILPDNRLRLSFSDISTEALISVHETPVQYEGETLTYVQITVPVLLDVPIQPALVQWVALERPGTFFGRFSLIAEAIDAPTGMLILEHGLTGNFLDPGELHAVLMALLSTANNLDEELAGKFGGRVVHAR